MSLNTPKKTRVLEKLIKLTATGRLQWKPIGNIETYVAGFADTLLVFQHTPSGAPLLAIGPVFIESVINARHKQLLMDLSTLVKGVPFTVTEEMQDDAWELLEAGCTYLEAKNNLTIPLRNNIMFL